MRIRNIFPLILVAAALISTAPRAAASPRWEDCDLDGFSDATGEPVPWVGFDDTKGDRVPANWDGQTHEWDYYPENRAKLSSSSSASAAGSSSPTASPAPSESVSAPASVASFVAPVSSRTPSAAGSRTPASPAESATASPAASSAFSADSSSPEPANESKDESRAEAAPVAGNDSETPPSRPGPEPGTYILIGLGVACAAVFGYGLLTGKKKRPPAEKGDSK